MTLTQNKRTYTVVDCVESVCDLRAKKFSSYFDATNSNTNEIIEGATTAKKTTKQTKKVAEVNPRKEWNANFAESGLPYTEYAKMTEEERAEFKNNIKTQ